MSQATEVDKLEAKSYPLDELVGLVRSGRVRLPDFQRRFRWKSADVERLFDSIYRGFPIGTLLFWKRPAPAGDVVFGGVSWSVPEVAEALWVIDGQQRIASLALTVLSDLGAADADQRFNVYFDPSAEEFRTAPAGRALADSFVPVATAFDLTTVLEWTSSRGASGDLRDRAFALTKRLRDFRVPAYLVETSDEKAVRQIFDRMNTFGRRMKRSEVFDALHGSLDPDGIHRLAWVGDVSLELDFGEFDEQQLIHAVLATRGSDVLRDFHREFADEPDEGAARSAAFEDARRALGRTIEFLKVDASVSHARLIPHQHLFVALVRFFHLYPSPSPRNRVLLRRWFWRAALVGPQLKGGTTGTLRQTVAAVTAGSEYGSVSNLLRLVPTTRAEPPVPASDYGRLSTADGRIALAALLSLVPRSPFSDDETAAVFEPIAPDSLLGTDRSTLSSIFPSSAADGRASTLSNRLLIAEADLDVDSPSEKLLDEVSKGNELLGASHLIDAGFVDLARSGRAVEALERRASKIADVVRAFVRSRAEWDLPDRAAVADLVDDDHV